MSKHQIRKEIAVLIDSIKEHSDNIGDIRYIPQLELESILHKIERLYQKAIVFNYLNSMPEITVTEKPKWVFEEVTNTDKPDKQPEKKEEAATEKEKSSPADPRLTPGVLNLFGGDPPAADEKPKTEKQEEKRKETPSPKIISKPAIADLKAVIGINEKFQFTNELFRGNANEYSLAIHQLNNSESLESAMDYFNGLQSAYGWDMENETVKRLLDLTKRRFS